jgi:hypothetical protein
MSTLRQIVKTGIHAKSLILPTEKLADLEELIEEYYRHHQPASPEARLLVDDLITCEWRVADLPRGYLSGPVQLSCS